MYKNVFLDLPFISSFGDGVGFMVSVLDSGVNIRGFEPWLGTLCYVLRQDTLL